MLVLKKEPKKRPVLVDIECNNETFHKELDCRIYQVIYPFEELVGILCDEEAKLTEKPSNQMLSMNGRTAYDILCGNILVVGLTEADFTSLSERDAAIFGKLFDSEDIYPGDVRLFLKSERDKVSEKTAKSWYRELKNRSE